MTGFIKHRVASGLVTGVALLIGVAPAVSAATIRDSQRYAAVDKAVEYLHSQQLTDGSISGAPGASDWSAVGLASAGVSAANFTSSNSLSLGEYFLANADNSSTSLSDVEKRILALKASGQDITNEVVLLKTAAASGGLEDPLLANSIFGILAIAASSDNSLTPTLNQAVTFLINNQHVDDGGFSYTADCTVWCGTDTSSTASALVAIEVAKKLDASDPRIDTAEASALSYINSFKQADGGYDGGFGSGSDSGTTSWVLIAFNTIASDSLNDDRAEATQWLLDNQASDGSFSFGSYNPITTSDTIVALLGTNWLLNPTSIARPVAVAPSSPETTPTPVVVPAAITQVHPIISYVATGPATPAPYNQPEAPNTTTADQSANPPTSTTTESQKTENHSHNTFKYIGYGLIVIAVLGVGFYIAASRQKD